jgi:hypothetical protein
MTMRNVTLKSPGHVPPAAAGVDASTSDDLDGASAPGVVFAYDIAASELEKQEAAIRDANGRLGILLVAVFTFMTFYFKEIHVAWLQIVVGIVLLAILVLLLFGYVPQTYFRAPNPHAVTSQANLRPGEIKENALGTMLRAHELNAKVVSRKNQFFALALVATIMAAMVGILGETVAGVVHYIPAHHEQQQRAEGHARRSPTAGVPAPCRRPATPSTRARVC